MSEWHSVPMKRQPSMRIEARIWFMHGEGNMLEVRVSDDIGSDPICHVDASCAEEMVAAISAALAAAAEEKRDG